MSASAIAGNRVKETTTTTGTGTLTLAGAVTGFQGFVAGVGDGQVVEYVLEDANGTAWEHGLGTITDAASDTLSRTTILASSNAGSAINLSAGTHTVYATPGARTLNRLALPVVAITDAAVTMAVNRCYRGSIAAWATSNRSYTLPDTAAVGDRIRVEIEAGNDSFELLIKTAAAGSLVNGVDAGTEWSRLFITGECVEFVCVKAGGAGDTDWLVAHDGRIPCCAVARRTGTAQSFTASTWEVIEFDTTVLSRGIQIPTSTPWKTTFRRAGNYLITVGCSHNSGGLTMLQGRFKNSETDANSQAVQYTAAAANANVIAQLPLEAFAAGDQIAHGVFFISAAPSNRTSGTYVYPIGEVREVLP